MFILTVKAMPTIIVWVLIRKDIYVNYSLSRIKTLMWNILGPQDLF